MRAGVPRRHCRHPAHCSSAAESMARGGFVPPAISMVRCVTDVLEGIELAPLAETRLVHAYYTASTGSIRHRCRHVLLLNPRPHVYVYGAAQGPSSGKVALGAVCAVTQSPHVMEFVQGPLVIPPYATVGPRQTRETGIAGPWQRSWIPAPYRLSVWRAVPCLCFFTWAIPASCQRNSARKSAFGQERAQIRTLYTKSWCSWLWASQSCGAPRSRENLLPRC